MSWQREKSYALPPGLKCLYTSIFSSVKISAGTLEPFYPRLKHIRVPKAPPLRMSEGSSNDLEMVRKRSLPWQTGEAEGHQNRQLTWDCQAGDVFYTHF